MVARIYKPSKSAMQSGMGQSKKWILELEHDIILEWSMGLVSLDCVGVLQSSTKFYPSSIKFYRTSWNFVELGRTM